MNQPNDTTEAPEFNEAMVQSKLFAAWAETLEAVDTWHLTSEKESALRLNLKLHQLGVFDENSFQRIQPIFGDEEVFKTLDKSTKTLQILHAIGNYFARSQWTPGAQPGLSLDVWLKIKGKLANKLAGKLPPTLIASCLTGVSKLFLNTINRELISTSGLRNYKETMGEIKKDLPKAPQPGRDDEIMAACFALNLDGETSAGKSNLGTQYLIEKGRLNAEKLAAMRTEIRETLDVGIVEVITERDALSRKMAESRTKETKGHDGPWLNAIQRVEDSIKKVEHKFAEELCPSSYVIEKDTRLQKTWGHQRELMSEEEAVKSMSKELWLNSFEKGFEGDTILYLMRHPSLKKMVGEKLKQANSDGLFSTILSAALESTNSVEVALALQLLAKAYEEAKDPLHLLSTVGHLTKGPSKNLEKLWLFLSFFKDPKVQIMQIMKLSLEMKGPSPLTIFKDYLEFPPNPEWAVFDLELVKEFYFKLATADSSPKAIGAEVNGINTGVLPPRTKHVGRNPKTPFDWTGRNSRNRHERLTPNIVARFLESQSRHGRLFPHHPNRRASGFKSEARGNQRKTEPR